jgi:hypothetical protein
MTKSKKGEDHDQVKVKTMGQPVVVKERKRDKIAMRRRRHATKIGMEKGEAKKEGGRKEEEKKREKGDCVFVGHLNLREQREK